MMSIKKITCVIAVMCSLLVQYVGSGQLLQLTFK